MREDILFVPNWLGDCVMALPGIHAYRKDNPETRLIVAARKSVASFFNHVAEVDEVLILPDDKVRQFSFVAGLRQRQLDTAFVLPHSFRAALLARVSGAKHRRGTSVKKRGFLFTEAIAPAAIDGEHQYLEYAVVLSKTMDNGYRYPEPLLCVDVRAVDSLKEKFELKGRVIGMLPGAARGPSKQWMPERFAEVGKKALEGGVADSVIILGSPGEVALGERICNLVANSACKNLCGKTALDEFPIALKCSSVIVCNDSGGMHVASALGVPVVAIFGTTNPSATGPLGKGAVILQKSDKKERAVPRECPLAKEALEAITVDEVFHEVSKILSP